MPGASSAVPRIPVRSKVKMKGGWLCVEVKERLVGLRAWPAVLAVGWRRSYAVPMPLPQQRRFKAMTEESESPAAQQLQQACYITAHTPGCLSPTQTTPRPGPWCTVTHRCRLFQTLGGPCLAAAGWHLGLLFLAGSLQGMWCVQPH